MRKIVKEFMTVLMVAGNEYRIAVRSSVTKKIIRWVTFGEVCRQVIYPDELKRENVRLHEPACWASRDAAQWSAEVISLHEANAAAL